MTVFTALKSLFGSTSESDSTDQPTADTVEYNGFQITPAPIKNGNMYRVAAIISKGQQTHRLIRADEMPDPQTCIDISLRKAREMIDQQGDNIFARS